MEVLKRRPRVFDYVFPNMDTGRPYNSLQRVFEAAIKAAKLEGRGLTPYALRRTRLTRWNVIDPVAAMAAAGHEPNSNIHYKNYVNVGKDRLHALVSNAA
ncbi:MAG: hypothetical protein V1913_10140, partial [Fibrobacterota bacterium]